MYSRYDVNRDGVVDMGDVSAAAYFYMAGSEDADWSTVVLYEGKELVAAWCDVNNSGRVDITDLILILNNLTVPLWP